MVSQQQYVGQGEIGGDWETLYRMQRFVEKEATLLDNGEFREWLDLFCGNCEYWAPAARNQTDAETNVSLFYDTRETLETRVERLYHPMIHCQIPKSCTMRLLGNFVLVGDKRMDQKTRCISVRSKFIMLEDRPGVERRLFGGTYEHTLVENSDTGRLHIKMKKVILTNCDGVFPNLTQPL